MKKFITSITSVVLSTLLLAGCGGNSASETAPAEESPVSVAETENAPEETAAPSGDFDSSVNITVVSREDGSGTRGAFIELLGVEEKQEDGTKIDNTTLDAVIINSTSVMLTTVSGDPYAIGYISLGSLDDSVKALDIDGVSPTAENIKNETYPVARPFNIATSEEVSDVTQDFIDYILSAEGQAVVEENGYIPLDDAADYSGNKPSGKIVVAGSSSVTPVMEKLKEAYEELNPNAEIEIQQSDSSTGMSAAIDGICDIGMASRELKESELEEGLAPTVIAMDGIAVIVNNDNPASDLSSEQVKNIYIGETLSWSEVA